MLTAKLETVFWRKSSFRKRPLQGL